MLYAAALVLAAPTSWADLHAQLRPGAIVVAAGGFRESIGLRAAGFEIRDTILVMGSKLGTMLIIARKRSTKTVTETVIEHGTGTLNVDASRIESQERLVRPAIKRDDNSRFGNRLGAGTQVEPGGRWPSNVMIADQGMADALDAQSGTSKSSGARTEASDTPTTANVYGAYASRSTVGHDDEGGCSRFFQRVHDAEDLRAYLLTLITPPDGDVLVVDSLVNGAL